MSIVRLLVVVSALLAGTASASVAQSSDLVCPAPISTCQTGPDAEGCPAGYRCTCVPSCPTCRDCAAQVCVPEAGRQCQTACDCTPGLMCDDGRCVAGFAPVFCCESERCPLGQQCQHRDGRFDRCGQQCETACDCDPGLACIEGQCIAGFAPVFCCESDTCPAGQQCQHRDGRHDRCRQACVEQAWRCENPGTACEQDRVCACSASCPNCEDCGPGVCVPRGTATPYRCNDDGSCDQAGDRCQCVSSCPACDDCTLSVCVPNCDPMCDRRARISSRRIDRLVAISRQCRRDSDCVAVDVDSGCRSTCGAFVNQRYSDRLKRWVAYLDQRYCATFTADACGKEQVHCGQQRGACVDGQCVAVPVQP